jgi:hypothetical protein
LTDQTTCPSEMLKRTPSENFCQKGPAVGGGTPGAGDTCPCRHWGWRHAPSCHLPPVWLAACPSLPPAACVGGGMAHLPPVAVAAWPTCRQWGWRHAACRRHARPPPPRQATCRRCQRRQGLAGNGPGGKGSFLTKIFGGGPF